MSTGEASSAEEESLPQIASVESISQPDDVSTGETNTINVQKDSSNASKNKKPSSADKEPQVATPVPSLPKRSAGYDSLMQILQDSKLQQKCIVKLTRSQLADMISAQQSAAASQEAPVTKKAGQKKSQVAIGKAASANRQEPAPSAKDGTEDDTFGISQGTARVF